MKSCLRLKDVCIFAFVLRDFAKSRVLFVDDLDEKLRPFKKRVAGSSPANKDQNSSKNSCFYFRFSFLYSRNNNLAEGHLILAATETEQYGSYNSQRQAPPQPIFTLVFRQPPDHALRPSWFQKGDAQLYVNRGIGILGVGIGG